MNMESPGFWTRGSSWRAAELAAVLAVTPMGFLVVGGGAGGGDFSRPARRWRREPPCTHKTAMAL